MQLDEVHDLYDRASAKASDIARQLAFAGIAIVWLFSGATTGATDGLRVPDGLLAAGFVLVLMLSLDFLHAVYRAGAFAAYARYLEWKTAAQDNDGAPAWIHWPSIVLFWGKLIALAVAYVQMGSFLLDQLSR